MIIRCKTKQQFKKVLSFLKGKGLKWENGDDLENGGYFCTSRAFLKYWNEFKSKTYVLVKDGSVVYGGLSELEEKPINQRDKQLLKEAKENEKIPFNEENLNKLFLISQLLK